MSRTSNHLFPLTYEQKSLLEYDARRWSRSTYKPLNYLALRITGPLSAALIIDSFGELIARHGALRTRIVDTGDTLWQQPGNTAPPDLVPMRHTDAGDLTRSLGDFLDDIYSVRTDLVSGNLFEVKLIRLSDDDHVLAWGFDSKIMDAVSIRLMFRQLWGMYAKSVCQRVSGPWPQYIDYALWQQGTGDEWERQHGAYWSLRLAGATPIHWPINTQLEDRKPLSDSVDFLLSQAATAGLRESARRARVSLGIAVLTVFAAAVHRWCDQSDFIVPLNFAGQQNATHARTIGLFADFLYLRMTIDEHETYNDLLRRVAEEFTRAASHQDSGRLAIRSPHLLWSCLFTWYSWSPKLLSGLPTDTEAKLINISVEPLTIHRPRSSLARPPFDIHVSTYPTNDGIAWHVFYPTDVFTRSSVEKFAKELQLASRGLVENPSSRVREGVTH